MLVYLVALGPQGLRQVAMLSADKSHYLSQLLTAIPGVKLAFSQSFFNEFAFITNKSSSFVLRELLNAGILAGVDLSEHGTHVKNGILVATTEMNSRAEIEFYAQSLRRILTNDDNGLSTVESAMCSVLSSSEESTAATKI
jgi:glycine dehydrogenase subunit 1